MGVGFGVRMAESSLILGGHLVGNLLVVPDDVRGIGTPLSPALAFSIDASLTPHAEFTVALQALTVTLWLPMASADPVQVASAARVEWPGGFCSHETGVARQRAEARFPLTEGEGRLLELHAGRMLPNAVPLELRFEPRLSWALWSANEIPRPGEKPRTGTPPHSFPNDYGVAKLHAEFHSPEARPLTVQVGREAPESPHQGAKR